MAEYLAEQDHPPCPSVALDDHFLVKNGATTNDELKAALAAGK
ncbi:hypothetical protein NBG4_420025 [Candidatus Sulfobium mesophilum]|uniref:Uncharacterized protein n=1 Tax=Candidatus Sulfobium mesophilum TaxID=2016548 RepID=A0A2U3QI66_9BACT|nr:hypothetical protein NBG4_420025 [Candidatus Sulfobium mesophilum]